jgi:signal transduction histidine kinase
LIIGLGVVGSLVEQHITEMEVHKRELEAALKLADAANKSKSKFLATMSHELRSPLNVIIGFSELLKKGVSTTDEKYRDYVGSILNSGVHLLRLVNDILDISKFDAGQLQLNEETIDLTDTINALVRLIETEAAKSGVSVTKAIEPKLSKVRCDEKRLRQILTNLLSNAIKFTPRGGEVRVSAFNEDDSVAISVADTGIGMNRNDIPKALERFGQIDSEMSRKFDGAGLGLPLAQHLVELHGGQLRIESEPGIGTIVTVLLPATRVVRERQAA